MTQKKKRKRRKMERIIAEKRVKEKDDKKMAERRRKIKGQTWNIKKKVVVCYIYGGFSLIYLTFYIFKTTNNCHKKVESENNIFFL